MNENKNIEVIDLVEKEKLLNWVIQNKFVGNKAYMFTHGGIFHGDDLAAASIYIGACKHEDIVIIRISRDDKYALNLAKRLESTRDNVIVADIGGGEYDHHGLKKERPIEGTTAGNTPPDYASAGLVWKDFGKQYLRNLIIQLVGNQEKVKTILNDDESISQLHRQIDEEIIQPIDAGDNGKPIKGKTDITDFYEDFYPDFYDENPKYNEAFLNALRNVRTILEFEVCQLIGGKYKLNDWKIAREQGFAGTREPDKKTMEACKMKAINKIHIYNVNCSPDEFDKIISDVYDKYAKYGTNVATSVAMAKINHEKNRCIAKPFLEERIQDDKYFRNGILEIPAQTIPWKEFAIDHNEKASPKDQIYFVLMIYSTGGYAIHAVPISREKMMENKVSLFQDNGYDLTQLHKNLFFARAKDRKTLEQFALEAIDKAKNKAKEDR